MHGFFLFSSLLGLLLCDCAHLHKVRLLRDKGVSSQTPPEVVTLHCASQKREDANIFMEERPPSRAHGSVCVCERLWLGEFIHLSVWVTEFIIFDSHSFSDLFMQRDL